MKIIRRVYLILVVVALIAFVGGHVVADEKAKININTATVKDLIKELKGIGKKKAAAIVAYREEHGSFATIEDVDKVEGIGAKTFKKIKDHITVGE